MVDGETGDSTRIRRSDTRGVTRTSITIATAAAPTAAALKMKRRTRRADVAGPELIDRGRSRRRTHIATNCVLEQPHNGTPLSSVSANAAASDFFAVASVDDTVPRVTRRILAISLSGRSATNRNTTVSRCRGGNALTNAHTSPAGGSTTWRCTSRGSSRRSIARRRARRWSTFTATRYAQPLGASISATRCQCCNARASASSVASLARSRSPHRASIEANTRGWATRSTPRSRGPQARRPHSHQVTSARKC